ncbi:MAG: DUF2089 domain-containing protein [Chloroflexota bacterium]
MIPLPSRSPFTGGEIIVTRFYCPDSDVTVDGRFSVTNPFAQLSQEQLSLIELFVRSEGRISRMEGELGLSYPTIRNRLREVIQDLGYEPGQEDDAPEAETPEVKVKVQVQEEAASPTPPKAPPPNRQEILEALNQGEIGFDTAMERLKG